MPVLLVAIFRSKHSTFFETAFIRIPTVALLSATKRNSRKTLTPTYLWLVLLSNSRLFFSMLLDLVKSPFHSLLFTRKCSFDLQTRPRYGQDVMRHYAKDYFIRQVSCEHAHYRPTASPGPPVSVKIMSLSAVFVRLFTLHIIHALKTRSISLDSGYLWPPAATMHAWGAALVDSA